MRPARAGEEEREVGYRLTVDEAVELASRDLLFYEESGGGVTFSGGEPLLQAGFLAACLERCKRLGMHTCLDTAGAARVERLEEICRWTDLFLYDLKTLNPEKFKRHAGDGLELVAGNLRRIVRQGAEVIIRVPVIPGVNAGREDVREIAAFLREMPSLSRVQLLPYHRHGAGKYARLGRTYEMDDTPVPREEEMEEIRGWFREAGFEVS
jgi:pyruvate formate lyase activating enzyme